jgi:Fic family protein
MEMIEQIPVKDLDNPKLNERQKRMLLLFRRKRYLKMPEVEVDIKGVTNRTLRRDITGLVEMGLVQQIGSTKDTKYRLVKV